MSRGFASGGENTFSIRPGAWTHLDHASLRENGLPHVMGNNDDAAGGRRHGAQ